MLLNMTEVQEINIARVLSKQARRIEHDQRHRLQFISKKLGKKRTYYNLQGVLCQAEYVWICLKKNPFQIKRSKLSASPVVMIDMPVFASFIEREWNTIVRS